MEQEIKKIKFKVQGSAFDPYITTFELRGKNLIAHCTCPAGEYGQYCKHRLNILRGNNDNIVSRNKNEVQIIVSWLPGTDVDIALNEMNEAQRNYEYAINQLKKVKKKFAKSLMD